MIDISGWQLRSGEFAQHVEDLLARYEVPGDRLILALSPDGLTEVEPLHPASAGLLARGVRLALRDFNLPLPEHGEMPLQILLASAAIANESQMTAIVAEDKVSGVHLVVSAHAEATMRLWIAAGAADN